MIGRTNAMVVGGTIASDDIVASSIAIGQGSIPSRGAIIDGNYVFVIGSTTISKIAKSNLEVLYTLSTTDSARDIFALGEYIYVAAGNYVKKYTKTDLTLTETSVSYGGSIGRIATDGTNLYVGGATTQTIRKYALSDLSTLVGESASLGGTIASIAYYDGNIYAHAGTTIRKYDTSTLTLQATSTTVRASGGTNAKVVVNGSYLYFFCGTAGVIFIDRLDLATLNTYTYGEYTNHYAITDFTIDGSYIYVVGQQTPQADILYASVSGLDFTSINELATGNNYVYLNPFAISYDASYFYILNSTQGSLIKIAR